MISDVPVNGKDPRNPQCGAEYPCYGDPDDPCFCGLIGPARKRGIKIRYSARFTEQMRDLSGDARWPLRATETDVPEQRGVSVARGRVGS